MLFVDGEYRQTDAESVWKVFSPCARGEKEYFLWVFLSLMSELRKRQIGSFQI